MRYQKVFDTSFFYLPLQSFKYDVHTKTLYTHIASGVFAKEPFRATLLQSPGWNEGKARYETLGK